MVHPNTLDLDPEFCPNLDSDSVQGYVINILINIKKIVQVEKMYLNNFFV